MSFTKALSNGLDQTISSFGLIIFQLFKIKEDINHINNKEFSYRDDINYLRELLMFENLTSNPSKVDNKKYLDRLLLI